MKRLNIELLRKVNDIPFGADRQTVRNSFGEFNEFRKSQFSKNTTDDFGAFHIFYDTNNCFEAIEIFEAEVFINDVKVFPGNLLQVQKIITTLNSEDNEYWSDIEKSVGLCAPDGEVESILFGKEGYYDS